MNRFLKNTLQIPGALTLGIAGWILYDNHRIQLNTEADRLAKEINEKCDLFGSPDQGSLSGPERVFLTAKRERLLSLYPRVSDESAANAASALSRSMKFLLPFGG